eukprot:TRINITY_DN6194_c0_g1_i1.p1 TRINITY_DN6194_c0_g1~~TRINITY_DN6194_c0_g1_i1.p1  ORF type:complete len:436 (+),score=108.02 TRINITY_DN6194_c0_g1_i1:540-1847(+)
MNNLQLFFCLLLLQPFFTTVAANAAEEVIDAIEVGELERASDGLISIATSDSDGLDIAEVLAGATAVSGSEEIAEAMGMALAKNDFMAIEGLGLGILICLDNFKEGPVYDTCVQSLARAKALGGGCEQLTLTLTIATALWSGGDIGNYKKAFDEARVTGCVPFIAVSVSSEGSSAAGGIAVSRSQVVDADASAEAFVAAVASGDASVAGQAFSSASAEPEAGALSLQEAAEEDVQTTASAVAEAIVQGDSKEISVTGSKALSSSNSSDPVARALAQAVADAALQGYLLEATEVAAGALNSSNALLFASALASIVDNTDACKPVAQALQIAEDEDIFGNLEVSEVLSEARSQAECLNVEDYFANSERIQCPLIRCLIPRQCCEFDYKVVGGFCQDRTGNPYTYAGLCERRKTLLREGGTKVVVQPTGRFGLACYCE